MRIALVGSTGQLGRELARTLPADGVEPLTRKAFDLRDPDATLARLTELQPEVVINAAADNRVDAAEADPREAVAVNALAVGAMARACRDTGAWLVHVSTDYVFDGRQSRPYEEDDPPAPLGAYARSKLAGELLAQTLAPRHAILRVAGLYAAGGSRGKGGSFVDRILERARRGEALRIVADQVTAPTWARDVAESIARLLPRLVQREAPGGVYHVTNGGACSWHAFARAALQLSGLSARVDAITTDELRAPAPRPAYSVLANSRLVTAGLPALRPWRDALAAYLEAGRGTTPAT